VIPGERTDESVRELPADRILETVTPARRSLGETCHPDAMVEQAADGFAVGLRRYVHGTVVIGGIAAPLIPGGSEDQPS
jgi:hypothetical protein